MLVLKVKRPPIHTTLICLIFFPHEAAFTPPTPSTGPGARPQHGVDQGGPQGGPADQAEGVRRGRAARPPPPRLLQLRAGPFPRPRCWTTSLSRHMTVCQLDGSPGQESQRPRRRAAALVSRF